MAVSVTSREELAAWLEDKPREWAQVIALRAALRVLPFVCDHRAFSTKMVDARFSIAIIKSNALSFAAFDFPRDHRNEVYSKAAGVPTPIVDGVTATIASVQAAAVATAHAGAGAFPAYNSAANIYAANAAYAGNANSQAAGRSSTVAFSYAENHSDAQSAAADIWRITSEDCDVFEAGASASDVLFARIWPDAPEWWREAWDRARRWLSRPEDGFEIWREWYYGRIEGLPHAFGDFDDEADEAFYRWIVAQDDDWWSRKPADVNADIKAKVEGLRAPKQGDEERLSPEESRAILEQAADPEAIFRDGKFTIRASLRLGSIRSVAPKNLAETLIDLSAMLADGLEDNAPRALRSALNTYSKSLARNPKEPSSDTLEPAAGVVRKLHRNDGHEVWAKGLGESFESFLNDHARLLGKLPEPKQQAEQRAMLILNEEAAKTPLEEDVQKLRGLADTLKEAGLTDENLDAYFADLTELGSEIAFAGPDFDQPDAGNQTAPATWTPKDLYRANVAGVGMQMHTIAMTALAVTAHPSYPVIISSLSDFAAYMLRYFT